MPARVVGRDGRQAAQHVGQVGEHVHFIQPRALDDRVQRGRGRAGRFAAQE